MDCSTPGFPVLTIFRSLLKLMFIESVMLSNHLILCCALLLLPSILPSIMKPVLFIPDNNHLHLYTRVHTSPIGT